MARCLGTIGLGNVSGILTVTTYIDDNQNEERALTMSAFVFFLIPIALAATAIVLGIGIYSMAKGGKFAAEHSNKLMRLRVTLQAVAIVIMFLFLFLIGKGPGSF